MVIVGIDPGQTGAIAILSEEAPILHTMKDICWFADMMESLKCHKHIKVYIERAQPMPKNGSVSMFKYGQHFGELLGVLTALQIPYETIPPTKWTLAIHQTRKSAFTPKARSLQAVQRLFPGIRLTDPASDRARVPHQGIVDALLIAEYGRRQK